MAERLYIPVFLDWSESTKRLTAEEKGRLIDALVAYAKGEDWETILQGNEMFLADELRLKIDRHYEISSKRAVAGAKGGKQTQANASKTEQKQANTATNTKTNTNTNTKTYIFKPPAIDEVREYCKERDNNVDAEAFVDFYTSKGWMVGKNPMKDWKAAVRSWEQRDKRPAKKKPGRFDALNEAIRKELANESGRNNGVPISNGKPLVELPGPGDA